MQNISKKTLLALMLIFQDLAIAEQNLKPKSQLPTTPCNISCESSYNQSCEYDCFYCEELCEPCCFDAQKTQKLKRIQEFTLTQTF